VNVPVDPSTSRDHGDPEIVRGTTRDERDGLRTGDCTNCTKGSVGPPEDIERRAGPGLPEPDPELFLLAGMSAARARPAAARVLRARAELQAAIAEAGPGSSR
jgi:hypothetical protein